MRIAPVAFSFLSLAAPALAGKVWVVGPAPGQLHDLQDTLILAQEGDVVLVKSGTYESIRVVGRSVSVVAENGATVQLTGAIRVIDVPVTRAVVLSGLRAHGTFVAGPIETQVGLHVSNCAGQITAQDCTLTSSSFGVGGAVDVQSAAGVALVRCSVSSTATTNSPFYLSAIYVRSGARLSLDHVDARGATGLPGQPWPAPSQEAASGGPGKNGLSYIAPLSGSPSFVHASASTFVGGNGGNATWGGGLCTWCGDGGSGGSGIVGNNPGGQLTLLGVTAMGGVGGLRDSTCPGSGTCGIGLNGQPGQAIFSATNYTTLAGTPRTLTGPRLVRDTTVPQFNFQGVAGELVEIAVSRKPTFVPDAVHGGVLHIGEPEWRRIGVVPPSGTLTKGFKLPNLPVLDPGLTLFMQARFVDLSTGQYRLSNLHTIVEVDATY